jgi:predicted small metal-binding protein
VTKRIQCIELGIKDCDFVASGETAGDVVREVVEHLRAEHDLDMPDADLIMAGEVKEDPFGIVDPGVTLVVERLTKALDIVPVERPESPKPSVGRTPSS